MKAKSFSRRGGYHALCGQDNQDAVWTNCRNGVAVAVVCDGAGGFRHGGDAAALVSAAVGKLLAEKHEELYAMPGSAARRYLVHMVWTLLTAHAAASGLLEQELACTLVAAVLDRNGRGLCFHLGDGIALMRQDSGEIELLSRPENGLSGKHVTYLTMNCDMLSHLRLCRWRDPAMTGLCLMTDGAAAHLLTEEGIWKEENPDWNIKKVLAALENHSPMDDFSFALICR